MISIKMRGAEELNKFLKALPRGTMKDAIKAMADYMIGDDSHGLKHYPPNKHVTRAQAYPESITIDYGPHKGKVVQGYFSSRQYYFVKMLSLEGKLPYRRTGTLRDGWRQSQDPYRKTLFNVVPYAKHVMGTATQARHPAKVGWRKMAKVIEDNIKGGMRAATQAVARWIKNKGK
jgi:hypothetical protein